MREMFVRTQYPCIGTSEQGRRCPRSRRARGRDVAGGARFGQYPTSATSAREGEGEGGRGREGGREGGRERERERENGRENGREKGREI